MMNIFRNRRAVPELEDALELQPVMHALESAFQAPIPTMKFNAHAAGVVIPMPGRDRRWKPALVVAAVAVMTLAAIAVPLIRDGGAQRVSARELLARAASASFIEMPYHSVSRGSFYSSSGGPTPRGTVQTQQSDTWYRDAEHIRLESREIDNNGVIGPVTSGFLRDGDSVWEWFTDGVLPDGTPVLRVMHGSMRSALGRVFDRNQWTTPADLSTTLNRYTPNCSSPAISGKEEIAGRTAFVIDACGTTVWVDQSLYFLLKVEPAASSHAAQPTSIIKPGFLPAWTEPMGSEITSIDLSSAMPDSLFIYTPPVGAVVSEQPDLAP